MGQMRTAAVVLAGILVVAAPRANAAAPTRHSKAKAAAPAATHSMRGTVKSIDATTVVVERGSGKHKQAMTFSLDSSTHREGDITVGSMVSVKYKSEAQKLVALNVEPVKASTTAGKTLAR